MYTCTALRVDRLGSLPTGLATDANLQEPNCLLCILWPITKRPSSVHYREPFVSKSPSCATFFFLVIHLYLSNLCTFYSLVFFFFFLIILALDPKPPKGWPKHARYSLFLSFLRPSRAVLRHRRSRCMWVRQSA
jgi:hypothetical protein